MSIVRIGLAEHKKFGSGYDAIFKKKVKKAAASPVAAAVTAAPAKPAKPAAKAAPAKPAAKKKAAAKKK